MSNNIILNIHCILIKQGLSISSIDALISKAIIISIPEYKNNIIVTINQIVIEC